jgi:TRAP-type uncharacterized transport system substrate-binding protein
MSSSDTPFADNDPGDGRRPPVRRQQRRRFFLFLLLAGMFVLVAAAAAVDFALRPETLRIAVGPAGSDDLKLVQALAQTFARQKSAIRLAPIPTDGARQSLALLRDSKTDLAVARGDLDMPADAQSVAILRKNFVVLWAPSGLPAKGSRKTPTPKVKSLDDLAGHRIGVIGKTDANVTLLKVILNESGIAPDKVQITQFGTDQVGEMAHHRRDRPRTRRAEIPADRCLGGDRPATRRL